VDMYVQFTAPRSGLGLCVGQHAEILELNFAKPDVLSYLVRPSIAESPPLAVFTD